MFLKTTALSAEITSGSTTIGGLIDISDYKQIFVEAAVSGAIAGTGSLFITSISQADINPSSGLQSSPEFGIGQPAVLTLTNDGGSGWSYASSSITDIDAKWAVMSWTETSGALNGTGSVVIKTSLLR
jgi:hypothetical protein